MWQLEAALSLRRAPALAIRERERELSGTRSLVRIADSRLETRAVPNVVESGGENRGEERKFVKHSLGALRH